MQIETEIIESVVRLLQSRDKDNYILVASILEITAEDLTEETIASNVDKILVLTNHIIAEKRRTDDPADPVQQLRKKRKNPRIPIFGRKANR